MRVLALCLLLLTALCGASDAFAQPQSQTGEAEDSEAPTSGDAAEADEAAYQQHMKNGIKLFKESKWDGAVAEFWAAYGKKSVGSPLINLAMAYKRMRDPAKAIEVLELALEKHRDSLPAAQILAAENEVAEMRPLLAWVTVVIRPQGRGTKLYIDGRLQRDGAWAKPIALEPGTRSFLVKRSGFEDASEELRLTAGLGNPAVVIELAKKDTRAHGDGKPPVEPPVDPATPEPDGDPPEDAFGPPGILGPLRGVYAYGGGSFLTSVNSAGGANFEPNNALDRWGAGASLHLGYRVASWAAFEGWAQYSDIRVGGKLTLPEQPSDAPRVFRKSQMILKSGRFGLSFRGWAPGGSWIRFVGTLGAGFLVEQLSWRFSTDGITSARPVARGIFRDSDVAVGVFGSLDLGVEIEWSNVLFALMFQHTLQGTKHFDIDNSNVFGGTPMLIHGPSIRVGYGLW